MGYIPKETTKMTKTDWVTLAETEPVKSGNKTRRLLRLSHPKGEPDNQILTIVKEYYNKETRHYHPARGSVGMPIETAEKLGIPIPKP